MTSSQPRVPGEGGFNVIHLSVCAARRVSAEPGEACECEIRQKNAPDLVKLK